MKLNFQIIPSIIFLTSVAFTQLTIETNLINELGIGLKNADGIVIQGDYGYISTNDPTCGLYILDISNTDSPRIAGYVSLSNCVYVVVQG